MNAHHLVLAHPPQRGDLREVGPVVADGQHDERRVGGGDGWYVPVGQRGGEAARVGEPVQQHGPGRRHDLANGRQGARVAAPQQFGVEGLGLLGGGDLHEQRVPPDGQDAPRTAVERDAIGGTHANASTAMPAVSSASRTRRASSAAPGCRRGRTANAPGRRRPHR